MAEGGRVPCQTPKLTARPLQAFVHPRTRSHFSHTPFLIKHTRLSLAFLICALTGPLPSLSQAAPGTKPAGKTAAKPAAKPAVKSAGKPKSKTSRSTHPVFNLPSKGYPKTLNRLGTCPEFGSLHGLTPAQSAAGVRGKMLDGSGLSGSGSVLTRTHDELGTAETMWHAGPDSGGNPLAVTHLSMIRQYMLGKIEGRIRFNAAAGSNFLHRATPSRNAEPHPQRGPHYTGIGPVRVIRLTLIFFSPVP